ncbi:acyl carrier protein phosphodiesterase [Alcanivorax quisquiliarum]|uniref:ACP phosphodiesterase n=1 Tax=Alcanivorax quisquiliarum TaxID=2933565 RepID=A0ABT0E8F7_9GAMM|nr:ACP phosphodiesterase [Alcanivorax quisquiliarum]MCK0538126.1 ACP phosphodiesterase [Alcanivorax quisquiliarum]
MNYFAHLVLAQPTVASKVGNLMGDFMRGVREEQLPPAVRQGLLNHRLVDRVTDEHPLVIESRRLFSPERRRFAGVALDVVFDHFLVRHWDRIYATPLSAEIHRDYRWLREGAILMPAPMRLITRRMAQHDWFSQYGDLGNIGLALDRIAARIRFANRFTGIIEEVDQHYAELEEVFLTLYPVLQQAVAEHALEIIPSAE